MMLLSRPSCFSGDVKVGWVVVGERDNVDDNGGAVEGQSSRLDRLVLASPSLVEQHKQSSSEIEYEITEHHIKQAFPL